MNTFTNPLTNRQITYMGPTHLRLLDQGILDQQGNLVTSGYLTPNKVAYSTTYPGYVSPNKGTQGTQGARGSRGSRGSRHSPDEGPFCGPVAGLDPLSYPVNTPGRARAAMGRSVNAASHGADPNVIKQCACQMAEHEGWFQCSQQYLPDKTGAKYAPQYYGGQPAF